MKKLVVFFLFLAFAASSCQTIRDNRAAKNQPFKPHIDKTPQHKRR